MQGYLDMHDLAWEPVSRTLSGSADVIGCESYRLAIALDGFSATGCEADGAKCGMSGSENGLAVIMIDRADSGPVAWRAHFS
jgi:hypothetical protein